MGRESVVALVAREKWVGGRLMGGGLGKKG